MQYHIRREVPLEGIRFRVAEYFPGGALPVHCHENPRMVVVLKGGLAETSGVQEFTCNPWSLLVRPQLLPHSNLAFHQGALCVSIDLAHSWTKRLYLDSALFES